MLNFNEYTKLKKDQQFDLLMDSLSLTNRTPQYYVNWSKVVRQTKDLELALHTLNYLVGKDNIYDETYNLLSSQPNLIRALPTLLAIRDTVFEVLRIDEEAELEFERLDFVNVDTSNIKKYVDFAEESGLLDFLSKNLNKNLVDYVYGVEVGLDSNGRKNRSGTFMEQLVEEKVKVLCRENGLEYLAQGNAHQIKAKWNFDLSYKESVRNHDFAIFNPATNRLTIMEVNYYGGGGSKLKAVAGEFADLSKFIFNQTPQVQFIWITDGQGWHTANRPLRDAFETIDYIINLKMLNQQYLEHILLQ